jgi:hypothetical protein
VKVEFESKSEQREGGGRKYISNSIFQRFFKEFIISIIPPKVRTCAGGMAIAYYTQGK